MISSKILSNFRSLSLSPAVMAKSGHELNFVRHLQMQTLVQLSTNKPLLAATQCQVSQVRTKIRDLRTNYTYLRDRPLGPNKARPPHISGIRECPGWHPVENPEPYKRIIHYPEDGKYTIKPLKITKLGGRHPVTGIKVIQGVGGGSKQRYRWIDWHRVPKDWPRDGTVLEERVVEVRYDPIRKAKICLTGYDEVLRWQIATTTLKPGDLISTYTDIPDIPIRPKEGDAHPLGALPIGTKVCLVEAWPGEGVFYMHRAEQTGTILRRVGDRVVVKMYESEKRNGSEYAIPKEAMCVVGQVSIHPLKAMPIGSPNRMRWLGMTPRSGLWKRKEGRHGRKIKKPPPTVDSMPLKELMKDAGTPSEKGKKGRTLYLHCDTEALKGKIRKYEFDLEKGDWPEHSRLKLDKW